MSKRNFSNAERWAIWTVHGEKCWLCGELLSFAEMHVDHVIPETLLGTERLAEVFADFGLDKDFDLNSWANWAPAHPRCNLRKREHVFRPSPIIQLQIEKAQKKSQELQSVHDALRSAKPRQKNAGQIIDGINNGSYSRAELEAIASAIAEELEPHRQTERQGQPLMLAPGLTVLQDDGQRYMLKGRTGLVGVRPKGDRLDPSWDCPNCGPTGWNGTRCIQCGYMIDPD